MKITKINNNDFNQILVCQLRKVKMWRDSSVKIPNK